MKTIYLVDYLSKHFPIGYPSWTPADIVSHFLTEFGVDVKIEPHTDGKLLFLYKYDMIGAKWTLPLTHECRGIILRNSNEGWEVMSYPFNKFFNLGEGYCPISKEEDFNSRTYELSFISKSDGSCVQVFHDKYKNEWRATTLGTITPAIIHDSGVKFDDLFWSIVNKEALTALMVPGRTYLFELCAKLNRVVTRYATDRVYILGVRMEDGSFMTYTDIVTSFGLLLSATENKPELYMPARFPMEVAEVYNKKQAEEWVERQASNKAFGEYSEGFVVYDRFGPVCKMKNSAYLALHHSLSDAACTRNAVVDAFFKGSMDDLYPALPEQFQKFADKLKDWINDFRNYLNTQVSHPFHFSEFKTRKDYALYVQALPERERMFSGFFFSNQEGVCDKTKDLGDLFTKWICSNYVKYIDFFKAMEK